jgi:HSP20 family molecular chaperone IbpA
MKTFKKHYLFPLMLLCTQSSYPGGWFDRLKHDVYNDAIIDEMDRHFNAIFETIDDAPEKHLESMNKRIEHELKMLKEREHSLHEKRKKIQNQMKEAETKKSEKNTRSDLISKSFGIEEKQSEKDGVRQLHVIVHLPGFDEQDLKITTHNKNNQLHISGTKAIENKREKTEEGDNKKAVSRAYISEEFVSSQNINGKKRKLSYKNGTIDVSVDLPTDVKTKKFDTTFENSTLTVTFQTK